MLSLLGIVLMIVGGIKFVWALLFYILNRSGQVGTKISKKIGTNNEYTDEYLEGSKIFSKELIEKLLISGTLTFAGFLMYYFDMKK